jgi:hypothetical protein
MEANRNPETRSTHVVLDYATLFLCRQAQTWVVILESPSLTAAQLLRRSAYDTDDARFDLLSQTRSACPDADLVTTDGALEGADYEWRIEVRGLSENAGDLGLALQRMLSGTPRQQRHRRRRATRQVARGCRDGSLPSLAGRPLAFDLLGRRPAGC